MTKRKLLVMLPIFSHIVLAIAATPETPQYEPMSVRDFLIDGPKLAAKKERVVVSGIYAPGQGDFGLLYADAQSFSTEKYVPQAGQQPSVPLLTDKASHQLRAQMLSCQSNPFAWQYHCAVQVYGRAIMCTSSSALGTTVDRPCIDLEDNETSATQEPAPASRPRQRTQPAQPAPHSSQVASPTAEQSSPQTPATPVPGSQTAFERCMNYLRSAGAQESSEGEFARVCSTARK